MSEPKPPSLEELQRWLQEAITGPSQPADVASIDDIVLPSTKQTSAERLAVYSTAYYLRLVDCLREFFPCLRYAMGEEIFDDFALAYLQQHPSQSYTLHRLADRFGEFLRESRPTSSETQSHWTEFFVDLARLEHAIEVVFDSEGSEEN